MLEELINLVKSDMQPEGRALATASTLEQLGGLLSRLSEPELVRLSDLREAWKLLSLPKSENEPINIVKRRETCGELADFASQLASEEGELWRSAPVWGVWYLSFAGSNDPRQTTMATTFEREWNELKEEVGEEQ